MKTMWAAAVAMACSTCAMPGLAADGKRITGPEVVAILQAQGYRAKLETDEEGDPLVRTGMAGVNANLLFYDCEQGRCGSLQFRVGLDLDKGTTASVINTFNSGYRYGNAYLDEDNDPFLKFDFEVLHADHAAHIASQLDVWEDLLDAFLRETGYRGDGDGGGSDAADATLQ